MRFVPRMVTVAPSAHRSEEERARVHWAVEPADEQAREVGIWLLYPQALCGMRRTVDLASRRRDMTDCPACVAEWGVIRSSRVALARYKQRRNMAARQERKHTA